MSPASLPGHHNDVVLVGRADLVHVAHGHITAILLTVATGGDPLKIIVVPHPSHPAVARGEVIWVRGKIACDPTPERKALHFIEAAHLEIVKRRTSEHGQPQAPGPRGYLTPSDAGASG